VTSKWRITDRVQGGKPAKYKNDMSTIWIDTPIPANEVIEARRPDMMLKVKRTKTI